MVVLGQNRLNIYIIYKYFCIMPFVVFNRLTQFFIFCQSLGYAQLFQVFWRATLLQLPYGCLGNAIRWAKSSRHRPTWAAMPRQAPLENAQNGLQQPQQVILCSFPFPATFLISTELRTASFFVKSQRSFIDFRHLTIFFPTANLDVSFGKQWPDVTVKTKPETETKTFCFFNEAEPILVWSLWLLWFVAWNQTRHC